MNEAGAGERFATADWLVLARQPVALLDRLFRRQPPAQPPDHATLMQAWAAMLSLEQPGTRLELSAQQRSWLSPSFAFPGRRLAELMGLSAAARAILRRARVQYRLRYEGPALPGGEQLARLRPVVLWTAELCRGAVMDLAAHRVVARPVGGWLAELDDPEALTVTRQVAAEVVAEADGYWVHTHGMSKYGLPDLELRRVPPELVELTGFLLPAVANGAIEGAFTLAPGERLALVGPELVCELRDVLDAADHYGGDALRLVAPGAGGGSPEAIGRLLMQMVQATDPMVLVKDDDPAILAAHERAVAELPAFRERFLAAGRSTADKFLVKVGWPPQPEVQEYLWVLLDGWRAGRIVGSVAVHPQAIAGLNYGDRLEFADSQVYDWLIIRGDGSRDGNYTGEAIRAAQVQPPPGQA